MMRCPKCGTENPDDFQSCRSCGQDLTITPPYMQTPGAKTSSLAIVALVLGILSLPFVFTTGIAAIICGIVALVRIRQSPGRLKGKGLAIAGITVPAIWMPLSTILLVLFMIPAAATVHRVAKDTKQRVQLMSIETALELFNMDFGDYPPSDALDPARKPYCGAMKLGEAVMGRDLLGFHQHSVFRSDGMDSAGAAQLYPTIPQANDPRARKGPYLPLEAANAYRLNEIFADVGPFNVNNLVICDTYAQKRRSGKTIGMPILYYRANTSTTAHDISDPDNPENIYNYKDNHALLALGVPGQPGKKHPLFDDPKIFYQMTRNYRVTALSRPNRADTFILLSAGKDGLYGTEDDIANFDMQWKPE